MPYDMQTLARLIVSYELCVSQTPALKHNYGVANHTEADASARDVIKLAEAVTRNAADLLVFISRLPKQLIESIYSTIPGGFCLCAQIIDSFDAMGRSLQKTVCLLTAVTVAAGDLPTSSATNILQRIGPLLTLQIQAAEEMAILLDDLQKQLSDPDALSQIAVPDFILGVENSLVEIVAKTCPAANSGEQLVLDAVAMACECISQTGQGLRNQAHESFGLMGEFAPGQF